MTPAVKDSQMVYRNSWLKIKYFAANCREDDEMLQEIPVP